MSATSDICGIVAAMMSGTGAAVYIEQDGLSNGYKVNMQRLVSDADKIYGMIERKRTAIDAEIDSGMKIEVTE